MLLQEATKDNWENRPDILTCMDYIHEQIMILKETVSTDLLERYQLNEKICHFEASVSPSYKVYDEDEKIILFLKEIIPTVKMLMYANISKERKKELKKQMLFFSEVTEIDINTIDWNIRYNRNNQTYRMLISICYLVVKGLLQTKSDGTVRLMDFLDEQRMCRLYEKFIFEYYRKEHPEITANASQISWQLDNDMGDMLPVMQTDIMLSRGDSILIIDAKYYSYTMQMQFDTYSIHSGNLYQIFTYVKNKEVELADKPHVVSGMLLYAKTNETLLPNQTYHMSGNKISVKTLNLDCDFEKIAEQLDALVEEFLDREKLLVFVLEKK